MRDNDSKILTEMYSVVRENEQQGGQAELKQEIEKSAPKLTEVAFKIVSQLETPEAVQSFLEDLHNLLVKTGENPTQEQLDELIKNHTPNLAAESYIEEALGRQLRSRLAGLGGVKDQIFGARPGQEKRSYQHEKFAKRYEIFKNAMERNLKELQLDLKTTNVTKADPKIMQSVDQLVQSLGQSHMGGVKPSTSRGQEIRHTIGKFGQDVGTAGAMGAALLALAPVTKTLGAAVATKSLIGALIATGKKFVEKGERPTTKEVAIAALAGGAGGAISHGLSNMLGHAAAGHTPTSPHTGTHTPPTGTHTPSTPEFRTTQHLQMPTGVDHSSISDAVGKAWKVATDSTYGGNADAELKKQVVDYLSKNYPDYAKYTFKSQARLLTNLGLTGAHGHVAHMPSGLIKGFTPKFR